MVKPEWGQKRTCTHCNTRFYDLCKEPIICPKCATVFDINEILAKGRRTPDAKLSKKPALVDKDIDFDTPLEEGEDLGDVADIDDDNALIEDTSEFITDDDEDVMEVMDHIEDKNEDSA